jgi:SNF2 family DNA or RNA helicase
MQIGIAAPLPWERFHGSPDSHDVYSLFTPVKPPYQHQRRAVNEAVKNISEHGFHALFMEMGTGKTKSTIDTFMALHAKGTVDALVVIAPKTLMSTWTDEEIPKHLSIQAQVGYWDGKATAKSRDTFASLLASKGPIIWVANVEGFQQLNEELRSRMSKILRSRSCLMAIDESSTIKGPDAQRTKNLIAAGKVAKGRMILTGTETSKGPLDLYSQFEFLKPGFWNVKSFYMFRTRYAILEDAYGSGGRTFKKVIGYQRLSELMDKIAPYTTRALKKDCLDLPEKIRQRIYVELTQAQKKAYEELKKHLATILASGEVMTIQNKISLFTKFRQITGGTVKNGEVYEVIEPLPEKLKALRDDLQDTDEQAIVWCAFRGEIELVSNMLKDLGEVVTYDGSTDIDDRSEAKVAFQEGRARFFVANMKAGAYGLNLQNCHLQYFYSRDTSPQANWQAEDRSHRPGQTEPCVYKSLLCKGTVDERIIDLIEQSSDLRDIIRGMNPQDMYEIL